MKYKDEDGNVMYGYSQVSLDRLTHAVYVIGGGFLALTVWVLWQVKKYHVAAALTACLYS